MSKDEPEPRVSTKVIGITGGIGSGKSTVSQFIEENGYAVYYSDQRAKDIVNDDPQLKEKITELLGVHAYDGTGAYDRKYVAAAVFADEALLHQLNGLIHPAVKTDFQKWADAQEAPLVFKETALLFELKLNESCYKSLLVTADDNCRLKRVMDRDDKTYREVEAIMLQQMPEKDKVKLADYVIYNNGTLEELRQQTEQTLKEMIGI